MTDTPIPVDEALAAYASHPSYSQVIRQTHPSSRAWYIPLADTSAAEDPDLIGLVTLSAARAGMGVVVLAYTGGRHAETVARVVAVAHAVGRRVHLSRLPASSWCQLIEREEVAA